MQNESAPAPGANCGDFVLEIFDSHDCHDCYDLVLVQHHLASLPTRRNWSMNAARAKVEFAVNGL
jgi:hypothetical protein